MRKRVTYAFVQAQEISLNYHMKCEQWIHFVSGSFFNFNGTAGIWRKQTIEDVGGWNARTTVEDMDLSLRTYVAGWRAVFAKDICVLNELPSSFFAYRKQQHRWTCGPVQLWKRTSHAIWTSNLPWLRKLEINFLFFMLRKTSNHFVAFGLCFLVPLTVFSPEVCKVHVACQKCEMCVQVSIPLWALVHLPVAVTLTASPFTRRGWIHSVVHVLFENAMGVVKLWAVLNGLFDLRRAHEWIVTAKTGTSDKRPAFSLAAFRSCRAYVAEFLIGVFFTTATFYSIFCVHRWTFAIFLGLQGMCRV